MNGVVRYFVRKGNSNVTETKIFLVRRTEKISRPTNKQTNNRSILLKRVKFLTLLIKFVVQLHQQRSVILRVDSLALWKIMNEENAALILKNRGEKFSSGFLYSEIFGVG